MMGCAIPFAAAQVPLPPPSAPQDTVRQIQILKGNSLREKIVDTVSFQTIAGEVMLRESLTLFTCDSAAINKTTNVMEAYGNVHINQQDSIHTYAQYLKYIGKERMAYLKKNVRLTDKKGTRFTEELDYDLKTNIGNYREGGRVVNGKTTLTSQEGTYYGSTKDVYFKKNVHLVDPKYNITTDSLLYNTQSQVVTFITQTHIVSKEGGDIYTTSGTYDLKNGKAYFGSRTVFKDSTRTYVADQSAYDEKEGIAQLEGNAIIRDSVNGYTVLGGQIFLNKKDNSFLATRKPVLIFKGEGNDSTFVAADTLFSGVIKRDSTGKKILQQTDTLKQTVVVANDSIIVQGKDSIGKKIVPQTDTLRQAIIDSVVAPIEDSSITALPVDTTLQAKTNEIKKADTLMGKIRNTVLLRDDGPLNLDTDTAIAAPAKAAVVDEEQVKDTSYNLSKDTAIRYFQAFRHVRIYNDSM